MKSLKIFTILAAVAVFAGLFFAETASAICPLCTIAVGAGVGLSRWIGVDDAVTGLWIGGLIVSLIGWTKDWLEKKGIKFKGMVVVTAVAYYAVVIWPLYFYGIIGSPTDTLCFCGLDKLLFGIIVGSLAFWTGASWYFDIKEKNGGHAHFPFQKVVMPVAPLVIISIIFYFLTK